MPTLKDVKLRVRNVGGDDDGQFMTDQYLQPKIDTVYGLQLDYLSDLCSPFIEKVVEVPSIKAQTSDLSQYQVQTGYGNNPNQPGPLYGLENPYCDGVDWKPAGQPVNYYAPVRPCRKLPDYVLPGQPPFFGPGFAMLFKWAGFKLSITPNLFNIDLRVQGEYRPPPLLKDDDKLQWDRMFEPLVLEAIEFCWNERQNAQQQASYQLKYTDALDKIAARLMLQEQATPMRLGRASRRGSGGWYGNLR